MSESQMHRPRLQGKTAIVSGSGRGIGRAVALKLATEGACVVVNDIDAEAAQDCAGEIRARGMQAQACIGDVAAPDFGERFIATAMERFGRLDIIVNNAGYPWDAVIQNTRDEQMATMLNVHVMAPFRILRAAAAHFRESAKREAAAGSEVVRKVVNVSSIAAVWGNAGQTAYSTAKSALSGMTRTLSKEWGRYRVTVNCVAFGVIDTRLAQAAGTADARIAAGDRTIPVGVAPSLLEEVRRRTPFGRLGRVDEAAGAVFLFCSPESDYISGETIVCAGGLVI